MQQPRYGNNAFAGLLAGLGGFLTQQGNRKAEERERGRQDRIDSERAAERADLKAYRDAQLALDRDRMTADERRYADSQAQAQADREGRIVTSVLDDYEAPDPSVYLDLRDILARKARLGAQDAPETSVSVGPAPTTPGFMGGSVEDILSAGLERKLGQKPKLPGADLPDLGTVTTTTPRTVGLSGLRPRLGKSKAEGEGERELAKIREQNAGKERVAELKAQVDRQKAELLARVRGDATLSRLANTVIGQLDNLVALGSDPVATWRGLLAGVPELAQAAGLSTAPAAAAAEPATPEPSPEENAAAAAGLQAPTQPDREDLYRSPAVNPDSFSQQSSEQLLPGGGVPGAKIDALQKQGVANEARSAFLQAKAREVGELLPLKASEIQSRIYSRNADIRYKDALGQAVLWSLKFKDRQLDQSEQRLALDNFYRSANLELNIQKMALDRSFKQWQAAKQNDPAALALLDTYEAEIGIVNREIADFEKALAVTTDPKQHEQILNGLTGLRERVNLLRNQFTTANTQPPALNLPAVGGIQTQPGASPQSGYPSPPTPGAMQPSPLTPIPTVPPQGLSAAQPVFGGQALDLNSIPRYPLSNHLRSERINMVARFVRLNGRQPSPDQARRLYDLVEHLDRNPQLRAQLNAQPR